MRTTQIYLLSLLYLLAVPAAGSTDPDAAPSPDTVGMEDVAGGTLLVPAGENRYIPLPGMKTDVTIEITGVAGHVELTQTFRNPSTQWLEAIYVFPLPEDSAVTRLRMRVADRLIEGVVKKKAEARKQYEQARDAGRKASLVEQQRPNLFTSSVANIPPGESIEITLSYIETVSRTGDTYRLRVPLIAGPRYMPAQNQVEGDDAPPRRAGDTPLRNPNTIPPSFGKVNPVTIDFRLDAGFELDTVTSAYHRIELSRPGESRARGRLQGEYFADRDFDLRWRPTAGAAPEVVVFSDAGLDQGSYAYTLLMLQPPLPDAAAPAQPRELILIIDASGSMHGDSIEQALSAARFALSTLEEHDQFNLIRFSDSPTMLFPSPQPAGPAALAQAEHFLSRIDANGGTNMAAALHRAFSNPVTLDLLRQIVFLTDGAVGNEEQLFSMIAEGTRRARLFTVGIGSAPNGYFMRRAARAGRGSHTFIGRGHEVATTMSALFERLRKPALTDIQVDWHGASYGNGPPRVPDLYYGEPLTLTARLTEFRGVTLRGRYAGETWRHTVPAGKSTDAPWVSTLWARQRIKQLKDELLGGGDRDAVKKRITRIGLDHQLVTPYTSLVAVEHRVSRDPEDPLYRADTPANLPHGWSYRHVFGSLPQTSAGWRLEALSGFMLILLGLSLWRLARTRRQYWAAP